MTDLIRLNLGCGNILLDGFINVDLYNPSADVEMDIAHLTYPDNYADLIYSCHTLEHFHFHDGINVLKEWYRVLKPGGIISIETPDFLASCKKFIESDTMQQINMYSHFFAKPWVQGETHLFLYTETQLRWSLEQTGFINVVRVPARRYIGREDICLKLEAIKPKGADVDGP